MGRVPEASMVALSGSRSAAPAALGRRLTPRRSTRLRPGPLGAVATGSASGGSLAGEPGPLLCLPGGLPGRGVAGQGGEPGDAEGPPSPGASLLPSPGLPRSGRGTAASPSGQGAGRSGAGSGVPVQPLLECSYPGWRGLAQHLTESLGPCGAPLRCVHKSWEDASFLKMGLRLPPVRPFLEPFGAFCGLSTGALSLWVPAGPAADT